MECAKITQIYFRLIFDQIEILLIIVAYSGATNGCT